jgi:hypothetical protein
MLAYLFSSKYSVAEPKPESDLQEAASFFLDPESQNRIKN